MKETTIQVRLSQDEKDAFVEAAEISGIKLASWVRERLRLAATRELSEIGRLPSFIKPVKINSHE